MPGFRVRLLGEALVRLSRDSDGKQGIDRRILPPPLCLAFFFYARNEECGAAASIMVGSSGRARAMSGMVFRATEKRIFAAR